MKDLKHYYSQSLFKRLWQYPHGYDDRIVGGKLLIVVIT